MDVATRVSIALALLVALATPAHAGPSPRDRVLVVTANLLEGFNEDDLRDMSEMKVFVRRLLDDVAFAPDILLLQEVNSRSANRVADILTRRVGHRYEVAQDAGRRAFKMREGKIYKSDTAVLINARTMSEIGSSGYIVSVYEPGGGEPTQYKRNARALVREDAGGMTLSVTSIHIPRGRGYHGRVRGIADDLDAVYPDPGYVDVIGGDFNRNAIRAGDSFGVFETESWWDLLTQRGFNDAVYNVTREKGVDYVFARGGIWGGGLDLDYDKSRDVFYSDHRFRWAVVGVDETPPSVVSGVETFSARWTDPPRIRVSWNRATDAAGISEYDVYRSTDGVVFTKIGATANDAFYDSNVVDGRRYRYYVVAKDWSNNPGPSSATVSQVAGGGADRRRAEISVAALAAAAIAALARRPRRRPRTTI